MSSSSPNKSTQKISSHLKQYLTKWSQVNPETLSQWRARDRESTDLLLHWLFCLMLPWKARGAATRTRATAKVSWVCLRQQRALKQTVAPHTHTHTERTHLLRCPIRAAYGLLCKYIHNVDWAGMLCNNTPERCDHDCMETRGADKQEKRAGEEK